MQRHEKRAHLAKDRSIAAQNRQQQLETRSALEHALPGTGISAALRAESGPWRADTPEGQRQDTRVRGRAEDLTILGDSHWVLDEHKFASDRRSYR